MTSRARLAKFAAMAIAVALAPAMAAQVAVAVQEALGVAVRKALPMAAPASTCALEGSKPSLLPRAAPLKDERSRLS